MGIYNHHRVMLLAAVSLAILALSCGPASAARRASSSFPTQCGKQLYQPIKKRIVGGSVAVPNSWPWQVYLEIGDNMCGGSLIDTSYVVTAAHCFDDWANSLDQVKVYLGAHSLNQLNAKDAVPVYEVIVHEGYDADSMVNDIAIIALSRPVQISKTVNVICLPGPEATSYGQTVYVSGWGAVASGGDSSSVLKQVALHPMPGYCNRFGGFNSNKQMCAGAGVDVAGQDSCQGDSGGPLMFESSKTWYLNGIVSYGNGCALKGTPGVYTRVKYYLPWINDIIGN